MYIGLHVVCVHHSPLCVAPAMCCTHSAFRCFCGPFWDGTSVFVCAVPLCPALVHAVGAVCGMWSACAMVPLWDESLRCCYTYTL